ncbi:MAG TPA: response regulator transcription factor [Conexibacter sp.]|nr:response regulator transcription factor [Conexibacter sp.]
MTEQRSTILIIEDDRHTRTFLADNLAADGFEPIGAVNAREAVRQMETRYPDLAIVDLTLPDRDGLDLLKQVREADGVASRIDPLLPLLVLSGRIDELHRLRGFDKGADDVMSKPFSYPELRARIKALLRRSERTVRHGRLRVGGLEIDPAARTVTLNGRRLSVSQKEFALLRTLAMDPTRVFSKEELLRSLWGFRTNGSTRTLDSHACRLRQKLARDGDHYLVNVWGVGYRLVDGPLGAELDVAVLAGVGMEA